MRRVDRRTNALQTNRPTDRTTDTASYRGALSHLKMVTLNILLFRNCQFDVFLRLFDPIFLLFKVNILTKYPLPHSTIVLASPHCLTRPLRWCFLTASLPHPTIVLALPPNASVIACVNKESLIGIRLPF